MSGLTRAGNLAVVRVDEVIAAPAGLLSLAGRDVTVALSGRVLKAGDRRTFETTSWIFGEGFAFISLRESPLAKAAAARSRGAMLPPAEHVVRQHIEDADVVLSGRVVEVRAETAAPQIHTRGRNAPAHPPISEHDPRWRDAVIAVDGVAKGRHAAAQVIVRFPASRDVAWWRVPKLRPGDEGVWLLHRTQSRTRARGLATGPTPQYELLHAEDFQPQWQLGQIRALARRAPVR